LGGNLVASERDFSPVVFYSIRSLGVAV
jgi:hypothetical protein